MNIGIILGFLGIVCGLAALLLVVQTFANRGVQTNRGNAQCNANTPAPAATAPAPRNWRWLGTLGKWVVGLAVVGGVIFGAIQIAPWVRSFIDGLTAGKPATVLRSNVHVEAFSWTEVPLRTKDRQYDPPFDTNIAYFDKYHRPLQFKVNGRWVTSYIDGPGRRCLIEEVPEERFYIAFRACDSRNGEYCIELRELESR